jgi:threonylcarbamoyladenosine tRNA methylthiotransferase MtaB
MVNEETYRVSTLGCRVNRADSLAIERELAASGYRRAAPREVPSLWVVNTCAVTGEGMRKSRKLARKCARSGASVAVTGCAVDMDAEVFRALGVKAVVPNEEKERLVREVCECVPNSEAGARVGVQWTPEDLVRVPVKIQEGCERYCAYCIVPYLRPAPSSKPIPHTLEEIRLLRSHGVGEVVLCGIDLGSYREPATGERLDRLVSTVVQDAEGMWVRLSSIELSDVGNGLIELLSAGGPLCRHLHLPLQSGDARVLSDMGREYTPGSFSSRVEQIRRMVPGISITTDVIVGFPTEDESAFKATAAMIESIGFSRVHVFKYSRRRGTSAYKLGDPVDPVTKDRRAAELRALARVAAQRFHEGLVGRIMPVLVEATMDSVPGHVYGRAQSFAGVVLEGGRELVGSRVRVEFTSAGHEGLRGQIVYPARR